MLEVCTLSSVCVFSPSLPDPDNHPMSACFCELTVLDTSMSVMPGLMYLTGFLKPSIFQVHSRSYKRQDVFLSMAKQYCIVHRQHFLYLPSLNRHLQCFHSLPVMSSALVTIGGSYVIFVCLYFAFFEILVLFPLHTCSQGS